MLEMGFEKEIGFIMDQMPETRQTVFFSATFPEGIQNLSKQFQKNPKHIVIEEEKAQAALIEQFVYDYKAEEKFQTLHSD